MQTNRIVENKSRVAAAPQEANFALMSPLTSCFRIRLKIIYL
jgi:hypothetical protein